MSFDMKMDENPGLGCQNDIGDEIKTWDNHGCEIHDERRDLRPDERSGDETFEDRSRMLKYGLPKGPELTPAGWYRNSWTILL